MSTGDGGSGRLDSFAAGTQSDESPGMGMPESALDRVRAELASPMQAGNTPAGMPAGYRTGNGANVWEPTGQESPVPPSVHAEQSAHAVHDPMAGQAPSPDAVAARGGVRRVRMRSAAGSTTPATEDNFATGVRRVRMQSTTGGAPAEVGSESAPEAGELHPAQFPGRSGGHPVGEALAYVQRETAAHARLAGPGGWQHIVDYAYGMHHTPYGSFAGMAEHVARQQVGDESRLHRHQFGEALRDQSTAKRIQRVKAQEAVRDETTANRIKRMATQEAATRTVREQRHTQAESLRDQAVKKRAARATAQEAAARKLREQRHNHVEGLRAQARQKRSDDLARLTVERKAKIAKTAPANKANATTRSRRGQ